LFNLDPPFISRFDSRYLLLNSQQNVSNLNAIVVLALTIMCAKVVLERMKKKIQTFEALYSVFVYNMVVSLMMDYSL
jgi:hypothetical protein